MNLKFRKFQQGGAMSEEAAPKTAAPEAGAAGAPASGEDPIMQIAQMAAQALQGGDCNMAMQVCQAFIQMLQSQQGGGAPAPEQSEPVYRKGGTLVRRIRK